jgi:hypothetical protein
MVGDRAEKRAIADDEIAKEVIPVIDYPGYRKSPLV